MLSGHADKRSKLRAIAESYLEKIASTEANDLCQYSKQTFANAFQACRHDRRQREVLQRGRR